MPLVRFELRNEFRLGDPELYRASPASRIKDGDSKVLLDGVAVAGLVGLLRQLGDLAEFAADVFHDLHEQVTVTAARRRKILSRIQNIETALPLVEKAIKQQKSHLHFSYVGGSDWHAHIRENQSLLLSAELPRYMMDSYEECHDPPRLYLLDKFDHGGNGACLKRYSDPSYFRRVWAVSELEKADNTPRKKKTHTMKRKGSRLRVRELQDGAGTSWLDSRITNSNSRTRFASSTSMDGHSLENSLSEDVSSNLEPLFQSTNFDSKARESYAQQASDVNSELPDDVEYLDVSDSVSQQQDNGTHASHKHIELSEDDDDVLTDSAQEQSVPRSSSVTWDEKTEIVVPVVTLSHDDIPVGNVQDSETVSFDYAFLNMENTRNKAAKDAEILFNTSGKTPIIFGMSHFDEVMSDTDNFVDALNTIESETDTEPEDFTKLRAKSPSVFSQVSNAQTESKQDKAILNPDLSDNVSPKASLLTVDEVSPGVPNFTSVVSGCVQQPVVSLAQSQEFSIVDGSSECNNIHDVLKKTDHEDSDPVHSPQAYTSEAQVLVQHEIAEGKFELENSSPPSTSGLPTVQLWTNGILFGVEPSKPPHPGLANASSSKNLNSSKNHENSSGSQSSLSVHNGQQNDSSQHFPSRCDAHTDDTYLKQGFPFPSQPLSLDKFQNKQETSVVLHPPSTTYSTVGLNGTSQSTGIISSAFSDMAHRFLANTLQRKTLLSASFNSESSSTENGNKKIEETLDKDHHMPSGSDPEETSRQSTDENAADRSLHESTFSPSHYSGKSSPPLEHMKIYFHPLNGMGTSKVKQNMLGSSAHENIDDFLFPSYRSSQGPTDTIQDNFSESDDDTFCKSCSYSSDEPLSPGSYSNSELWEQDKRSEHFNNEMFDTTMDSVKMDYITKSLSNELQYVDVEGHKVPVVSGSSVNDLPNLDSILSVRNQQEQTCNLPNDPSCSADQEQDHSPPLPPPPPAQWRILKPLVASPIDSDANAANNVRHLDHLQAPTIPSEQLEHSAKLLCASEKNELKLNGEETNHVGSNKEVDMREELLREIKTKDQQMLNGHKNLSFDTKSCKEVDGHDELLHQIRNKSFNLRRTVTPKPRVLPHSTTNVANANVTAMLEKATAIRQAFVSSDETNDDGNWSDV